MYYQFNLPSMLNDIIGKRGLRFRFLQLNKCCELSCVATIALCMQLRFQEFTLVGSNQGNYYENTTACNKRTLKITVATGPKTIETLFKSFIKLIEANISSFPCYLWFLSLKLSRLSLSQEANCENVRFLKYL